MPGFDGTGPRGMGPMTGGCRGPCASSYVNSCGFTFPYGPNNGFILPNRPMRYGGRGGGRWGRGGRQW
jgi:hypothetical protein